MIKLQKPGANVMVLRYSNKIITKIIIPYLYTNFRYIRLYFFINDVKNYSERFKKTVINIDVHNNI